MKNTPAVYAALFLGVLAISTSAIFVKFADAPSSAIALYRLGITAAVLLPFLVFSRKRLKEAASLSKKQFTLIAASGILLGVHYVMWFESLRYTSIASSIVLVCLQPLFSLVFALVLFREVPRRSAVVGCLVSISGCVVIGMTDFQIGGLALFGDILAFLAAGVVALYFITGQAVRRTTGAVTYTVFSYGIGVVFLFVYALIRQDVLFGFSSSTWMALIGLALVATVGGQFLFNILLKRVSATAVTMSILGEPVGTCILAYFIFGDVVSVQQFFGICVILTGLSIYFLWPVLREHFERGKQS